MALKLKMPTATEIVTVKKGDGEPVEVKNVTYTLDDLKKVFDERHSNVGVKLGTTISTGNYGSIRIDVSLYMPCDPTQEEVDATFEFVKAWVDDKVNGLVSEIQPANAG
jgi:hypothetical protein